MVIERDKIKKIGIFGYFGAWNLGDEAVVSVLIENIRKRLPNTEIYAICLVPENVTQYHKIQAFPLRRMAQNSIEIGSIQVHIDSTNKPTIWKKLFRRLSVIAPKELVFLFRCYKLIKGFSIIVVGGSGQLIDNEGGVWNHPYNHFKWSILSKIVGARFVFLSVGAGPLKTWLGKWFIKESLSLAIYRSFRDEYSRSLASEIGVRGQSYVFPDQAFAIDTSGFNSKRLVDGERPVIGIAPIAYCDPRHWSESRLTTYNNYVAKIESFIEWLIANDFKIVLFHTQVNGDDRVVAEIFENIRERNSAGADRLITVHEVKWYPDALTAIGKTDLVVASRFHAIIFSYVMKRPVVGISYDPKIDNVMKAMGQNDYILDIENFSVEDLKHQFELLRANISKSRECIKEKGAEFKKLIQKQYDQVFGEERI